MAISQLAVIEVNIVKDNVTRLSSTLERILHARDQEKSGSGSRNACGLLSMFLAIVDLTVHPPVNISRWESRLWKIRGHNITRVVDVHVHRNETIVRDTRTSNMRKNETREERINGSQ